MFNLIKKKVQKYVNSNKAFKVDEAIMKKTGFNLGPTSNKMAKAFFASDFKMVAKSFPESITVVWYLIVTFILILNKASLKSLYDQLMEEWKKGKR